MARHPILAALVLAFCGLLLSACDSAEVGPRPGDGQSGPPDTVAPDAADDGAAAADAPAADAAPCTYEPLEPVLLACDPEYLFLEHQTDFSGAAACPDRWVYGDEAWPSVAEAAADRGCDTACVWRAATAVMFLHCGHRDEYVSWEAEGDGCAVLLQFSNGQFYESVEEYDAQNPCEE